MHFDSVMKCFKVVMINFGLLFSRQLSIISDAMCYVFVRSRAAGLVLEVEAARAIVSLSSSLLYQAILLLLRISAFSAQFTNRS